MSSQFGEDGIIQYLLQRVPIEHTAFVEFGVEDYKEANTRFLLQNNGWRGLVMDGSAANVDTIRRDAIYWRCPLNAQQAFITRENINDLLTAHGASGDIGLLSIDIDGNDYWVWEAITAVQPRIVICEFNALFGPAPITVPYDAAFQRHKAHHSNVYFGASLGALATLAEKKGYSLVAVTSQAVNAFFVRNDVATNVPKLSAVDAWRPSTVRESRGPDGKLTFQSPAAVLQEIGGLPVIDVVSGQKKTIREAVDVNAFTR